MITDHNSDVINDPVVIDSSLVSKNLFRPQTLDNYIGQENAKKIIKMLIESAKVRADNMDHILLHGLPGLGKTTLAQIVSNEYNAPIVITSGQALDKPGDVAALVTNLDNGGILFIDEIHRLKPKVEEILYTAMEDFVIDLVLGKGISARSMRLDVPKFTLIGSTTMPNKLSRPLRDRFGVNIKLESYTISELSKIISINANTLEMTLSADIINALACCSRSTPRIANHLLKRFVDYIIVEKILSPTLKDFGKFLDLMGITSTGLQKTDLDLITSIYFNFASGPVGLKTLSASINEDPDNIELLYEPFLMQEGLLARTHRGRLLTAKGVEFARKI